MGPRVKGEKPGSHRQPWGWVAAGTPPGWGQRELRADACESHGAARVPEGLLGSNAGRREGQSREGGKKKPNGGKKNKKPYNRGFVLLWLVLI